MLLHKQKVSSNGLSFRWSLFFVELSFLFFEPFSKLDKTF